MVFLLCTITVFVMIIDRITKYLAFRCDEPFVLIDRIIEIVQTKNDGIAFGLGGGMRYGALLWSVLSIVAVFLLVLFYVKYVRRCLANTIAFALIIGGALGNLTDRISADGKVLDFIQLSFINWPAFNIADMAIVVGVVIMVFTIVSDNEQTGQEKPVNSVGFPGSESP